jgi:glycosyltransferase involved in cell wall biosynthesis
MDAFERYKSYLSFSQIAGWVICSMRITFVLPYAGTAGGMRVAAIYAERLQARGHEVQVVCRPPRPISLRQQLRSVLKGRGWLSNHPSPYFEHRNFHLHTLEKWRPVTADDVPDADVVIATWWETAEWIAEFPASKGAKVYFVQHHEALLPHQPSERVKATLCLPMHKITIAEWLVDVIRKECKDEQATLVPNSVNTEQFNAPLRGKQPVPTVGVMYADVLWKGCDISLEAFSLAAKKIPNLRLVAFGQSHPVESLPLPPQTRYSLRPLQSEIKHLYAQCDAWLFGSRIEGFGLPILEAMACRTPVIGTSAGAAPELLKQGCGILVKPEDPQAMAEAIEQVVAMSEIEWKKMSQLAYERATSYTWDDATTLFETALHQAVVRSQKQEIKA